MALTSGHYQTQGQPLDKNLELFQLINNDLGREVVRLANAIYRDYPDIRLDISGLRENEPIGRSNPYRRFAYGSILGELVPGARLISPAISEIALKGGRLDVKNTYEDLGLVVYSLEGENSEFSQHLINQATVRGIEIILPMVFYDLVIVEDGGFPHQLRFDMGDIGVPYHVKTLSQETSNFESNDPELVISGFPGRLGRGYRNLFTGKDGLRRLRRNNDDLEADLENMIDSTPMGRVSFVVARDQ